MDRPTLPYGGGGEDSIQAYRTAGFISGNPGITATLYNVGNSSKARSASAENDRLRVAGRPAKLLEELRWLVNDKAGH